MLTSPPFRADHVGSLLRPAGPCTGPARTPRWRYHDGRAAGGRGRGHPLRRQDAGGRRPPVRHGRRAPPWVVAHGLHLPARRHQPGRGEPGRPVPERGRAPSSSRPRRNRVDGQVRLQHPIFADAFEFLASTVTTASPKLTIPSPSMVHYRGGRAAVDPAVYPDLDQFWDDLSVAHAVEVQALAALGCRYLQLDDTSLAYLNDPHQREMIASKGGDGEHQHERYIRQINAALAGRPEGLAITTHSCRGNFHRRRWPRPRLPLRGRGAVQRARRRRLLPGVRRRPLRWLRALALRPARQAGGARPHHHQAGSAGGPRMRSSAGSTRPPASCRWTSCACPRSAASPRRWRGTISPTRSRSPSSRWWSKMRTRCGAEQPSRRSPSSPSASGARTGCPS